MADGFVGRSVLGLALYAHCNSCGAITAVAVHDNRLPRRASAGVPDTVLGTVDVDAWLAQDGQGTSVRVDVRWVCPMCHAANETEIIGR